MVRDVVRDVNDVRAGDLIKTRDGLKVISRIDFVYANGFTPAGDPRYVPGRTKNWTVHTEDGMQYGMMEVLRYMKKEDSPSDVE